MNYKQFEEKYRKMHQQVSIHELRGTRGKSKSTLKSSAKLKPKVNQFVQYPLNASILNGRATMNSSPFKSMHSSASCSQIFQQCPKYPLVRFIHPSPNKENLVIRRVQNTNNSVIVSRSPRKVVMDEEGLLRKIKILESRVQELHLQKQNLSLKFHIEKQNLILERDQAKLELQKQKVENTEKINRLLKGFEEWKSGVSPKNSILERKNDQINHPQKIVKNIAELNKGSFGKIEAWEHDKTDSELEQVSNGDKIYEGEREDTHQESKQEHIKNVQTPINTNNNNFNPFDVLFANRQKMFGHQFLNCTPLQTILQRRACQTALSMQHEENSISQKQGSSEIISNEILKNEEKVIEEMMNKTS